MCVCGVTHGCCAIFYHHSFDHSHFVIKSCDFVAVQPHLWLETVPEVLKFIFYERHVQCAVFTHVFLAQVSVLWSCTEWHRPNKCRRPFLNIFLLHEFQPYIKSNILFFSVMNQMFGIYPLLSTQLKNIKCIMLTQHSRLAPKKGVHHCMQGQRRGF